MRIIDASKTSTLVLGYQGEDQRLVVKFPLADEKTGRKVTEEFPGGSFTVSVMLPDDESEYIVSSADLQLTENWLEWTVKEPYTVGRGEGKVQLNYAFSGMVKSRIWKTSVKKSISTGSGTVPSWSDWKTELLNAANAVQQAVESYDEMTATAEDGDQTSAHIDRTGDHPVLQITIKNNGGGGGAVQSVNGKTGTVVLNANDVGALPASTPIPPAVTVDSALSDSSVNPVQNKIIKAALDSQSETIVELKSDLNSIEEKTIEVKLGKNLYNPETDVVGMLSSDGTINASQTAYLTSDFIRVEGSENYFFSIRSSVSAITPVTTRHLSLVYDEDKNIISNTYQNVDDTPGLSISVPANGAYIRVSVHYSTGYVMQVEKGSSMTTYEAYSETLYLITKLGETPMNQITGAMDGIVSEYNTEHEVPIIQTRQLFDRSLVEVGYSDTGGWINTGSTGYVHTPKIDVSGHVGDTIYFSSDSVAKVARFITAYDSSGNAVSASGDNNGTSTPRPYTVPAGIASIVISYVNPSSDSSFNHFQAEYGKITGYAKYGSYFNIDAYLGKDNVLYGKKWVACGDSFTHGDFQSSTDNNTIQEGQYQGQLKVYPFLIGNRTGMNVINEAQNGSTMTHIEGHTNAFSDTRYTQIASDADYITLKFGINDDSAHQNVPIGTIDDATNETFYGAWNVVMNYLITHHLDAKIGIIITNGATLDIVNATIAIAEKWGVPYLNEATDKQCSFVFRSNRTDIPSAIRDAKNNNWYVSTTPGSVNHHPNAKAHEFESSVVEAWLRSL